MSLIAFAYCTFLSAALTDTDAAQSTDETVLKQIRAEYRGRFNSIRTMRIKFRDMPPLNREGKYDETISPKSFEWFVSGDKQLLTQEPWEYPRTDPESANSPISEFQATGAWDSFDGRTGYQVLYWPKYPDEVWKIFRTKSLPDAIRNNSLPVYLGLRLVHSQISLVDQLDQPGTAVTGRELVGDAPCVKVQLASYEPWPGLKHDFVVWLDAEHGYVLRKFRFQPLRLRDLKFNKDSKPIELVNGESTDGVCTTELRAVLDPVTGQQRWFPVSFAGSFAKPPYYVIDELEINLKIDSSKFTPAFPLGAEIVDLSKDSKGQESYAVGGEEGLALLRKRMNEHRIDGPQDTNSGSVLYSTSEFNAQPPTGSRLPQSAWIVSIVCFVISIVAVYQQRAS